MSVSTYFQRYAYPKVWINTPPNPNTSLIIVIPSFNEENIIPSLESLKKCTPPKGGVEVLVVINEPENASVTVRSCNESGFENALNWAEKHSMQGMVYHIIYAKNLPKKDHGVGLARKIGMDEALRRLHAINGVATGIIACFDSDSTCSDDYLTALETHFIDNPECPGVSIYFEHPLPTKDRKLLDGIIQYELHLRYFIHAQRFAGHPHAFHAIGSSMAVRARNYYQQGGMNKRKAGEDFYFLHKIIKLGGFMELKNTMVFPSPRVSNRVPFGTGKAMMEWMNSDHEQLLTYSPITFNDLKKVLAPLEAIYQGEIHEDQLPESFRSFIEIESFKAKINDMIAKTSDFHTFRKRFYAWFDAFRVMKFVHHCRDNFYDNVSVNEASKWLLSNNFKSPPSKDDLGLLLEEYRKIDRDQLVKSNDPGF